MQKISQDDNKSRQEALQYRQQMLYQIELQNTLIDQRANDIDHIATEITEINSLMKEMDRYTKLQAPLVDSIERHIEETEHHTGVALTELREARDKQRSTCMIS